ncbi:MAG: AAA family ATPase [Clostridiales bacterium]|nr:AAA family ATPase [Clostridiales bacterium]
MHISKIKANNFRNFYNLEIDLHDGLNVIVGPNNVGKTNIMRIISFLGSDPNSGSSIEDFNKYILLQELESIKEKPPIIEIEYTIEHDLNFAEEDSAFSKLSNILVFDPITGGLEYKIGDESAHLVAKVELRYEYDYKEIEIYKQEMRNANEFKDVYNALNKLQQNFKWNFYNVTSKEIIDKKFINNIFEIDTIDATRTIDRLTDNSRKYINDKVKDKKIDVFSIKQKITETIQGGLGEVKKEIDNDINEDQNQIGITNGKNKFVSNFFFEGELSDFFKYELEDDTFGFSLPLDHNGLGYNNLIYMRNLLKQKSKNDYNIILLEEPEAHLHPNMQYKLLKYIEDLKEQETEETKIKNQIFITTHSSNITATLNTSSIILLTIDRRCNPPITRSTILSNNYNYEKVKTNFDENLDKKEERIKLLKRGEEHISKFLDVTRSDILFSDKIILVEGIAEKLLLPKFFNTLVNDHISVIELGGINFNYFLPLVFNTNKKILCITDKDIEIINETDEGLELNVDDYNNKRPQIDEMFLHLADKVKVNQQTKFGSTFEKEIFIENYDNGFELLLGLVLPAGYNELIKHKSLVYWDINIDKEIANGRQKKFLKDMINKYIKLYGQVSDKSLVEKMFFTNLFYHYVKDKKGSFALDLFNNVDRINIPTYIKEGIEWLNS